MSKIQLSHFCLIEKYYSFISHIHFGGIMSGLFSGLSTLSKIF